MPLRKLIQQDEYGPILYSSSIKTFNLLFKNCGLYLLKVIDYYDVRDEFGLYTKKQYSTAVSK